MFIKNGEFRKHTHIISYVPPFIIEQPTGGITELNSSFELKTRVRGSLPISYQWYRNDVLIDGETENTLLFLSCQPEDNGDYFCVISNNKTILYTNVVNLNVISPPVIITNPVSLSAVPSTTASFSIDVVGSEPFTYTWYKNEILYSTSTSSSLFINNVKKSDEGIFYVEISNNIGNVTSLTASLFVYNKIEIVTQPDDFSFSIGQNGLISLNCVGTTPITAQWRKNNINYGSPIISNNNSFDLNFNNTQLTDEGEYDCVLTNIVGSITSNKSYVYVNKPPVITLQPISALANVGDLVTFTINTSGTAPINFQWIKNGSGFISGKTNRVYSISDVQFDNMGDYACIASNIVGSVTSEYVSLSVISNYLLLEDGDYLMFDSNTYWNLDIISIYLVSNNGDRVMFDSDTYWNLN